MKGYGFDADLYRAMEGKTVLKVSDNEKADCGLVFYFTDGSIFTFGFSGDEGGMDLDAITPNLPPGKYGRLTPAQAISKGYVPAKVYLDGDLQKDCYLVDDVEGWIQRYSHRNSSPQLGPREYGEVVYIPKGAVDPFADPFESTEEYKAGGVK